MTRARAATSAARALSIWPSTFIEIRVSGEVPADSRAFSAASSLSLVFASITPGLVAMSG